MKITVKDADGLLGDIVLGDDSTGDWIVDPPPLPQESRKAQVTPLFRAKNPFARGRNNRTVSFAWIVGRNHSSADVAGDFMRGHAGLVPINVTLTVIDGALTGTYAGVITDVTAVDRTGRETTFRYSITGAVLQAASTDSDGGSPPASPPPTDPTS